MEYIKYILFLLFLFSESFFVVDENMGKTKIIKFNGNGEEICSRSIGLLPLITLSFNLNLLVIQILRITLEGETKCKLKPIKSATSEWLLKYYMGVGRFRSLALTCKKPYRMRHKKK